MQRTGEILKSRPSGSATATLSLSLALSLASPLRLSADASCVQGVNFSGHVPSALSPKLINCQMEKSEEIERLIKPWRTDSDDNPSVNLSITPTSWKDLSQPMQCTTMPIPNTQSHAHADAPVHCQSLSGIFTICCDGTWFIDILAEIAAPKTKRNVTWPKNFSSPRSTQVQLFIPWTHSKYKGYIGYLQLQVTGRRWHFRYIDIFDISYHFRISNIDIEPWFLKDNSKTMRCIHSKLGMQVLV